MVSWQYHYSRTGSEGKDDENGKDLERYTDQGYRAHAAQLRGQSGMAKLLGRYFIWRL